MIETMGVILWIVGLLLALVAFAGNGERDGLETFVFFMLGVLLLSTAGYEVGRGNPAPFRDNTLYQIEGDPISTTFYNQEWFVVLATENNLTRQETKYYGETGQRRIENLKKGDIVLMTAEKAVVIKNDIK